MRSKRASQIPKDTKMKTSTMMSVMVVLVAMVLSTGCVVRAPSENDGMCEEVEDGVFDCGLQHGVTDPRTNELITSCNSLGVEVPFETCQDQPTEDWSTCPEHRLLGVSCCPMTCDVVLWECSDVDGYIGACVERDSNPLAE